MLQYLADRFDLKYEQRLWFAWLYACTYSAPVAFFLLSEFPDIESASFDRLRAFWASWKGWFSLPPGRASMKMRDNLILVMYNLRAWTGGLALDHALRAIEGPNPEATFDRAVVELEPLGIGRRGLLVFLNTVRALSSYRVHVPVFDIREPEASVMRGGLALAVGRPDLAVLKPLNPKAYAKDLDYLQTQFSRLGQRFDAENLSVVRLAELLIAYRGYRFGRRHVGYYLDRQATTIRTLGHGVGERLAVSVLWDFRRETYRKKWLREVN